MSPIEIESWTLRIVSQVIRGQPNEDSRVELKSEFPEDVSRAARQIAALANSSFGETVLWVIGVDEKARAVKGVDAQELSSWWPQIEAQFDEMAPTMQNVAVPFGGVVLIAFAIGADRAPFIVKVPGGGRVSREIPWREGNRTDSAKRSHLVQLLVPKVRMPSFEVLSAECRCSKQLDQGFFLRARMTLYVVPQVGTQLAFPFHKAKLLIEQEGEKLNFGAVETELFHAVRSRRSEPVSVESTTLQESASELIVNGPGRFDLIGAGEVPSQKLKPIPMKLTAILSPAGSNLVTVLSAALAHVSADADHDLWKNDAPFRAGDTV